MTHAPYRRFLCRVCGFVYDEAKGDPDGGLAPGTRYEDIPDHWTCPLCGVSKADLVLIHDRPPQTASRDRTGTGGRAGGSEAVVIVGAGIAGWSAAQALRQRLPDRPITLVSACDASVYPKPSLSVAMAAGHSADQLVEASGAERARELNITLRSRCRALRIDSRRQRLVTTRGTLPYGTLVLALGARPIRLPVEGGEEILQVNDLQSYRALRARLSEGAQHLTLIGAGLIGCEFADDLRHGGYRVTLLDQAPGLLPQLLPAPLAQRLQQHLARSGIEFRPGASVQRVSKTETAYRLQLHDGSAVTTDLVLSAVGLTPEVTLAHKTGLATARGIRVRARDLRTSAANIHALGDCAEVDGRVYSYVEPILRQAQTLAAALAGAPEPFVPQPPLIRIKTASLPLAVCAPDSAQGRWQPVQENGSDCHYSFEHQGEVRGFAVSGSLVRDADSLYRKLQTAPALPVRAAGA